MVSCVHVILKCGEQLIKCVEVFPVMLVIRRRHQVQE